MERECLLAAFDVLHRYVASGRAPQCVELGSLVSAIAPSVPALENARPVETTPPVPPALPKPPVSKPYMHPELEKISHRHGSDTLVVQWAIRRMTSDYTLKDIQALLKREGRPLGGPAISVILTRLKRRSEIEETVRSFGPKPALFGKPVTAPRADEASTQAGHSPAPVQTENTELTVATAAAA
jgi:hypothetical protein